jgi:DNA replication and repair protein RecF
MISDIRLQHFRSYSDDLFEFSPGVNIIVGSNASGKTNLLEAVLVSAQGGSFRVKDGELIAYEQDWARIDAHNDGQPRTIKLQRPNMAEKTEKTYEIDGRTLRRLSMQQTIPAVLFEPNHLQLLHGSPELRREYLDGLLEQIEPGFATTRREYRRALAQRNALLKRDNISGQMLRPQIFPWDVRLSELGGKIVHARSHVIDTFNTASSALYSDISKHTSSVEITYQTAIPIESYESGLLYALEANLGRDIERGFTGAGPHREDFALSLDGHPMHATASRGEVRTAVLMLKVLELRLLEQTRGVSPLLLLDDVFSELDGARRTALTSHLSNYQTFMTTTDADVVVDHFLGKAHIIPINRDKKPATRKKT